MNFDQLCKKQQHDGQNVCEFNGSGSALLHKLIILCDKWYFVWLCSLAESLLFAYLSWSFAISMNLPCFCYSCFFVFFVCCVVVIVVVFLLFFLLSYFLRKSAIVMKGRIAESDKYWQILHYFWCRDLNKKIKILNQYCVLYTSIASFTF